jgi:ribosomal protein S18 acetylase RimI-like enzyme
MELLGTKNDVMIEAKVFNEETKPSKEEKKEIVDFLFEHLDQYGDLWEDIEKAVDYSLKNYQSFGGFVLVSRDEKDIAGVVVVNGTGMTGYIPENILVYIATRRDLRGQGVGKQLMKKALETATGDIALHVEPDNPAKFLYEKLGFTNKYLEMRYKKGAAVN